MNLEVEQGDSFSTQIPATNGSCQCETIAVIGIERIR